ncbi:MAG: UbiH/UbiF/VisC/COQ6 family ubiquinone biosynthesis hydroxylase [Gammaproteobacteria bacterium]|nr:UbiH/UbiF/VisC/COQ6 family ubiquinone biosynthesis hydroxylase [Gammaproteobacteria bacterium]
MNSSGHRFDLIIVGGGIVGTTLAVALRQSGLHCALLDATQVFTATAPTLYDLRVSALSRASQQLFARLQVWPDMRQQRVAAFREMHVWETRGEGELHFDSAELGEPQLGHIVENRVMTTALMNALQATDTVQLFLGTQCQSLRHDAGSWRLRLESGEELQTPFVVGADGSHSWLREQAGIRVRGWDYDHTALVTFVKTELPHQETAWQRFTPTGPLAFLPLTEGYSSIVWSTRDAHARALCNLPDAQFSTELAAAFESRLGAITAVGPRVIHPLRFLHTEHYVQEGLALVGDAAHTIHPLAGQGLNLGLTDVACLTDVILDAKARRRPIHSLATLRRYERWRRAGNLPMLAAVEGFARIFDTQPAWVNWGRKSTLGILNHITPLKNLIIDYAMGNRID